MNGPRRGAGFVLAGAMAFATDATVLALLTRTTAIDPFTARIVAILLAMVAGYFAHRRFSFAVGNPPSMREFGKFLGVASGAAILNYAIYAVALLVAPQIDPLAALVVATAVSMVASYFGYRFGVFRRSG